jgi:hypothetical protein
MKDKEKGKAQLSEEKKETLRQACIDYLDKVNGLIRDYNKVADYSHSSSNLRSYETPELQATGKKKGRLRFTVKANYDNQGINQTRILTTEFSGKRSKTSFFPIDREGELPSAEMLIAGHNLIDVLIRRYAKSGLPTVAK